MQATPDITKAHATALASSSVVMRNLERHRCRTGVLLEMILNTPENSALAVHGLIRGVARLLGLGEPAPGVRQVGALRQHDGA